jgi:hypothetical protein
MKFSCPQCGQHISCDEAWAGHQTQCPACHGNIVVPQMLAPPTSPPAAAPPAAGSTALGSKLAAGATQVPRSTAHAPVATKKFSPRPPAGDNVMLKYGALAVVVVGLAGIGYFYGLPLLTNAVQQETNAKPPARAGAPAAGGAIGGPLGEVNEAMDVSDALDGGAAPAHRRAPATNNAARPRLAAPR